MDNDSKSSHICFGGIASKTDFLGTSRENLYCIHGKQSSKCCMNFHNEPLENTGTGYEEVSIPNSNNDDGQHCHRTRTEGIDSAALRKLMTVSVMCLFFMIGEIVGGYLSNSLAIATDAAHLLTDFASFMISLISICLAKKPPTKNMHYGWYRAEVIGALFSVLLIWVVTGILVYLAIQRILHHEYDIDANVMLITSGVGVIINIIMGVTLFQHGHTHGGSSHSHSHSKTGHEKESATNINVRAAFIHVVGDLLQSIGVLIAAVIIYFKKDWVIVDPVCTFIFSILVLWTTFNILKDALRVLMEGSPKGIKSSEVMDVLLKIECVEKIHGLRVWALNLDKIAMSCHIAISPGTDAQKILLFANSELHKKYKFYETTLQIEQVHQEMNGCTQCQNPT